jgi:hypothetical protein
VEGWNELIGQVRAGWVLLLFETTVSMGASCITAKNVGQKENVKPRNKEANQC